WVVAGIHDQAVGDEHEVELAALGLARDLLDDREVVVAGRGALVAPPGGVVAGAEDEDAEMHLTPCRTHWRCSPRRRMCRCRYFVIIRYANGISEIDTPGFTGERLALGRRRDQVRFVFGVRLSISQLDVDVARRNRALFHGKPYRAEIGGFAQRAK